MPPETPEQLLRRMEDLAQAIRGPGMGTSITYVELQGLLDIVHEAQTVKAQSDKAAARKRGGRGKPEPDALAEVVPVMVDIIENKADLWGRPIHEVIEAWAAQSGQPLPDTWIPAINKALGGD